MDVLTLELDPCSVLEMFGEPSVGEMMGGVGETDTWGLWVLGSVTLSEGVESDISSEVEKC